MEHRAHSAPPDRPKSGVRKGVLGIALAGTALVGICVGVGVEAQRARTQEGALTSQVEQLQTQLDQQGQELSQAQQTIEQLKQYSLLGPDGTPPEYTALYPDMYAQPWEGESTDAEERVVYLTFDDGPSSNTERILDILDQYGIKATFFVVGKTGEEDQQRMRDIVADGHTLGIHSWSHDYTTIYDSVEAYLDDFHQLYQWIYEVTGTYPQIFRFPGGSVNGYNQGIYQEIIAEMTRRGFVYFDWNASAQDAAAKQLPAETVAENCLKGIGIRHVTILTHDSAARPTTVDALPSVIEGYTKAGYVFRALDPGVKPVILNYKQES
jgi:peptidoglycan/xylan/chitin deacetylase (PgdA/CDA1 family)